MTIQQERGRKGELIARKFLKTQGYQIIEQNWRFSHAEIDLIARKDGILVFVEVKTRSRSDFGQPTSFVSSRKEMLMADAAHEYLCRHDVRQEIRFDVIGVLLHGDQYEVEHISDAFFPGLPE